MCGVCVCVVSIQSKEKGYSQTATKQGTSSTNEMGDQKQAAEKEQEEKTRNRQLKKGEKGSSSNEDLGAR